MEFPHRPSAPAYHVAPPVQIQGAAKATQLHHNGNQVPPIQGGMASAPRLNHIQRANGFALRSNGSYAWDN
ncbi:hypothetical protein JCGZ_03514 [Jatropha curcas]|uniref:Uncharacterized protein n=1 Tax=Jatropha curcas TaxID=180498 RepID=A0A067KYB6_JATCU|nr:hypothetical protein JCGZ_03514 [Jatropha curcas]